MAMAASTTMPKLLLFGSSNDDCNTKLSAASKHFKDVDNESVKTAMTGNTYESTVTTTTTPSVVRCGDDDYSKVESWTEPFPCKERGPYYGKGYGRHYFGFRNLKTATTVTGASTDTSPKITTPSHPIPTVPTAELRRLLEKDAVGVDAAMNKDDDDDDLHLHFHHTIVDSNSTIRSPHQLHTTRIPTGGHHRNSCKQASPADWVLLPSSACVVTWMDRISWFRRSPPIMVADNENHLCLSRTVMSTTTTFTMTRKNHQQQQQHDDAEHESSSCSIYHHHNKQRIGDRKHGLFLRQQQQQHQRSIEQEELLHHEPLVNLVGDVGAILFAPLDLSRLRSTTTTRTSSSPTTSSPDTIIKPFAAGAASTSAAYSLSDRSTAFTASTLTMESSLWSERTITPLVPLTTSTTPPPVHFYRDLNQSAAIMTSNMTTATEEEGEEEEEHEETASGGSEREEEEDDDDDEEAQTAYPVELQWEDSVDLLACPRILTSSMMQQIHDEGLPESLQLNQWERCFAIGRDGDCFLTLLDYCAPYTQTLVCIRTTRGHVLGGFVSHPWRQQEGYGNRQAYYGSSGVSFLFCSHPGQATSYGNGSSSSGSSSNSIPAPDMTKELQIYKWTGCNDYCQICNVDQAKLAMGGHGDFGLIVEDNFWHGQTGHCSTYNNPPLIPNNDDDNDTNNNGGSGGGNSGGFFEVEAFEIYGLVPYTQSFAVPSTATDSSDKKHDLFKKTITDTKGGRWIRTALHGS